MKKLISIMFAMLILASGMHYSIATHFCGGEVASKKISFNGSVASCGMESSEEGNCSNSESFNSNCCKNTIDTYSLDSNYENTVYKVLENTKNLLHDFYIPVSISFNSIIKTTSKNSGVSPPQISLASSVNLADLCIFRI